MAATPKVVIIGAGIVGTGLADELVAARLDRRHGRRAGPLYAAGGSRPDAPGLVFQTNPSKTMTEFAKYTVAKYSGLTLDGRWCFRQVGGLEVATTEARLADLRRRHGYAQSWGSRVRAARPRRVRAHLAAARPGLVLGGYLVPSDGLAKAVRAAEVMARRAIEGGARVVGECTVTGIRTDDGRVRAVITDQGEIPADVVVSCAGIWGPRIGAMVGMATPIQPLAHLYARTGPVPALAAIAASAELEDERPILRHQDRDLYFREHVDRMGIGAYGHRPLPVEASALLSPAEAPVMPSVLDFTPATSRSRGPGRRSSCRPSARRRSRRGSTGSSRSRRTASAHRRVARRGRFLGRGGRVGDPLRGCRARRRRVAGRWRAVTRRPRMRREPLRGHQLAPHYVRDRGLQNFIEVYDVIHPLQPMEAPRPLRTSPFYEREQALGASFLEGSGWERPQWYEANAGLLERLPRADPRAWRLGGALLVADRRAEALATRDGVALYDMTSLKRIEVVRVRSRSSSG